MNIKNTLSLEIDEAVELLSTIAASLEKTGKFQFNLRGQEVSVDAGDNLRATLGISLDEFSILFSWQEEHPVKVGDAGLSIEDTEQKAKPRKDGIPTPAMPKAKPVTVARESPKTMEATPMSSKRALPDRMALSTTTLPLEGGYWAPAFTANSKSQWVLVQIDGELENRKWGTDDQITTLSDLTPEQAKPKTVRSSPASRDEDLFSELDDLETDTAAPVSTYSNVGGDRQSAAPAGQFQNIPQPTSISPEEVNAAAEAWKEPSPEDNITNDDWVKPSEFLKEKGSAPAAAPKQSSGPESIPSPKTVESIPKPSKIKSELNAAGSVGMTKAITDEINEWREPRPEDNVTEDDWVRPSEFLDSEDDDTKTDNNPPPGPPSADSQAARPPPTAPDKKKKEDQDEDKGWASWE